MRKYVITHIPQCSRETNHLMLKRSCSKRTNIFSQQISVIVALLAHSEFVVDFPLLFAQVDKRYPLVRNEVLFSQVCVGDTLANLRTVSCKTNQKLFGWKNLMDLVIDYSCLNLLILWHIHILVTRVGKQESSLWIRNRSFGRLHHCMNYVLRMTFMLKTW